MDPAAASPGSRRPPPPPPGQRLHLPPSPLSRSSTSSPPPIPGSIEDQDLSDDVGPATTATRPTLTIQAAKQLMGRVVTTKADKTVGVEVARLAPHPKYKRREHIKKKYQVHDPDNQFKVGDVVELRRSHPISKTKHFLAAPLPPRDTCRKSLLLPPLESQADADVTAF